MSKGTFFAGITFGAIVGVASAYLFAPQSGDEFKKEVSEKGKKVKHKAILATDDALNATEQWLDKNTQEQQNETKVYGVKVDPSNQSDNNVVEQSYNNL